MHYQIVHRTTYRYDGMVTVCHYQARLAPRTLPSQDCPWHELVIRPEPQVRASRQDSFGNATAYFEIEGAHQELEVTSCSLVEVRAAPAPAPEETPAWETIRGLLHGDGYDAATKAGEYAYASPLIPLSAEFAAYASPSFPPGRPILAGVCDLNGRIHRDFAFDPTATDVATPIDTAFKKRRGVCQDFAQVMIACVRSMGLAARYISGYLETRPPPGQEKLTGADASHAWVSVWCGEHFGWVDADPTNNLLPDERHITLAWGRDFNDVSPLRGVILGAGRQKQTVAVDVIPLGGGL